MGRLFRQLGAIPKLLAAFEVLKADVEQALQSAEAKAAWKRFTSDPAIARIASRLSAEWRAVEQAVHQMK